MTHMTALETDGGFIRVSGTEKRVCEDIASRQRAGIKKYGTTVENNPLELHDWVTHLYEELLDASIYCKRILQALEMERDK